MPIVGHHVDQKRRVMFTMTSPNQVLAAEQVLSLDPESVELYQYFHGGNIPYTGDKVQATPNNIPHKLHLMIINYIEVGHYEAAMDIIEMEITYKRKPAVSLLLALVDIVLQVRPTIPGKMLDDNTETPQRAHRLLFYVLENWGADIFSPLWRNISERGNRPARKIKQEEDEEDDLGSSLREFDDFWELVSSAFELPVSDKADSVTLRRRLLLDIMIKVQEYDLRQRRDDTKRLASCLFLSTLKADSYGGHSKFDQYLDILFRVFAHDDDTKFANQSLNSIYAERHDMAARLLNMFIVLSYCDNLVSTSTFINQAYRRFAKLNADNCANLLQTISCTTFISALCDMVLADSNCSMVETRYKRLRKAQSTAFKIENLFHFAMKTQPLQLETMQDIYRHILIVVWRFMSYINECSLRCDVCIQAEDGTKQYESKVLSGLMQSQLEETVERGPTAVANWRDHIMHMMKQVKNDKDEETVQKIWWTIELAQISINNGL